MQFKLFVATDYKYRGTPVINYHPSFNMKIEGPLHSRLRPGTLKPLRAKQVRDIQFLADYYTHLLLRPGTHRPLQANPVKDLTLILLIKALTLTRTGTSPSGTHSPLQANPTRDSHSLHVPCMPQFVRPVMSLLLPCVLQPHNDWQHQQFGERRRTQVPISSGSGDLSPTLGEEVCAPLWCKISVLLYS